MSNKSFHRELKLDKMDAAEFLRELADNIADDGPIKLNGEDWQLVQPYKNVVPFRITQDDDGLEVDLKLLAPDSE